MTATHVARPFRVSALMIAAGICLSLMVVFARFAAESHSIVEITFFRNFIGALCLGLIIVGDTKRRKLLLHTTRPYGHIIRGVTGLLGLGCNFWAATMLPLANSAALFFSMPLIVTMMAIPFLHEKVDWRRWSGVIIGFVGILIIAHPTGGGHMLGNFIALAGALCSAGSAIMIRKLGTSEPEIRTVFYFFLFGAVASALVLPWYWTAPTWQSFGFLIATALAGTCGQLLQTRAYAEAPAGYLSSFNYLSILYSTFFGWLIWNEWPTLAVFIGASIVIASGVMTVLLEKSRTAKAEAAVEASYG